MGDKQDFFLLIGYDFLIKRIEAVPEIPVRLRICKGPVIRMIALFFRLPVGLIPCAGLPVPLAGVHLADHLGYYRLQPKGFVDFLGGL